MAAFEHVRIRQLPCNDMTISSSLQSLTRTL